MRRMSVLGIGVLALACAGWAAEGLRPLEAGNTSPTAPTRETTDEVLSLTLAADKVAFGAKEPLEFKLTVRNVSRQAYTFTTGRAHYYWQYHIKAADRDAEYEAYCAALFEAAPDPFSARLAPGETAVHPVELGDSFGFRPRRGAPSAAGKGSDSLGIAHLPPGKYTMTVAFDYGLVSEETVAGKVTVGPVAFTVTDGPVAGGDAGGNTASSAVTVVKGATVKGAARSTSGTVRRPAMPSGWHLAAVAPSLAVFRSFEEIPPDLRISEVRTPPKDGRAAAPPHVESKSIKEWLGSLGPEFGDLQRNMLVLVAKEKPEGCVRIREARLTNGVLAVEYTDEAVNPKADLNPVGGADLVLCARHDVLVAFFENGQAVCRPIPLALQKVTGGLYPTVSRSYPATGTNGVARTSLVWTLNGQQSRAAVSGGIGYHSAETVWTVLLGPAPSIKSDPPELVVRGPMCGVATLTSEDLLQRWEVDMRSGTLIGGGRLEGADRERALDELVGLIRVQLGRAQADPLLGEDSLQRIERRSASLPQAESGAIAKELADIRVRLPLRRAQVCLDQARKEYQDGHRAEAWKNLEFARTAVAKAREAGQRARADELTGEIEKVEKDVDAMRDVGGLIVTVTGADGSPAAKVDMAVWGRELGATPRVDSPRYWSGCTDARGMCRVPLSGGTLLVEARVPSISGPTAEPVFTAPPRMEVQSPATSTARVELRLQRGAVVCVRLCGPDGEPRPRDNLTFRHKTLDFTARAKVSRDGSNDYWAGPLPPGTYSIAVQVNMGGVVQDAPPSAGSIEVTVAAGERKDIDVRLKDLPRASHSQR